MEEFGSSTLTSEKLNCSPKSCPEKLNISINSVRQSPKSSPVLNSPNTGISPRSRVAPGWLAANGASNPVSTSAKTVFTVRGIAVEEKNGANSMSPLTRIRTNTADTKNSLQPAIVFIQPIVHFRLFSGFH